MLQVASALHTPPTPFWYLHLTAIEEYLEQIRQVLQVASALYTPSTPLLYTSQLDEQLDQIRNLLQVQLLARGVIGTD